MNLSDLLKRGLVKKIEPDKQQAREVLSAAERDLKTAGKLLGEDDDWAFSIAYNAMLQATRALMFNDGYAPVGEEHHVAVVGYAEAKLGAKYRQKIDLFDDMRKKRHHAVYDRAGVISNYEAKHALKIAGELVELVRNLLKH